MERKARRSRSGEVRSSRNRSENRRMKSRNPAARIQPASTRRGALSTRIATAVRSPRPWPQDGQIPSVKSRYAARLSADSTCACDGRFSSKISSPPIRYSSGTRYGSANAVAGSGGSNSGTIGRTASRSGAASMMPSINASCAASYVAPEPLTLLRPFTHSFHPSGDRRHLHAITPVVNGSRFAIFVPAPSLRTNRLGATG